MHFLPTVAILSRASLTCRAQAPPSANAQRSERVSKGRVVRVLWHCRHCSGTHLDVGLAVGAGLALQSQQPLARLQHRLRMARSAAHEAAANS